MCCDYSLEHQDTIEASQGLPVVTHMFPLGQIAFCRVADMRKRSDEPVVCMRSGTELAFERNVLVEPGEDVYYETGAICDAPPSKLGKTAKFDQVHLDVPNTWHDILRFPSGHFVYIGALRSGQRATVLQLPAKGGQPVRLPMQETPSALTAEGALMRAP